MNTVLPIVILLVLGGLSALALHRLRWPFLIRSGAAAVLATAIWFAGSGRRSELVDATEKPELKCPGYPGTCFGCLQRTGRSGRGPTRVMTSRLPHL